MICYDYINDYIRQTIRRNEGFLAELEAYAQQHHVPIVHPEVGKLLEVLGRMIKPRRILEVGTAIGYSSLLLSQILAEDGQVDTIERNEDLVMIARENIAKAGKSDVIHVICGSAEDVLACLDKSYDMIFLDAAKGQYEDFLHYCIRMLRKDGVLISDNVLYKGMIASDELVVHRKKTIVTRMREYLSTICNMPVLDTSIIPIGDGVAVSYKVE